MLRAIYAVLLRLHPHRFREEFADEMLWIFDQAADTLGAIALVGDALQSLVTQWMFRSDLEDHTSVAPAGGPAPDRVPVFYTAGSDIPPPGALVNGLIGSVGVFALACFALAHSGGHARIFTYYSNDFHTGPPGNGGDAVPSTRRSPTKSFRAQSPGMWAEFKTLFHESSFRNSPGESTARSSDVKPGPTGNPPPGLPSAPEELNRSASVPPPPPPGLQRTPGAQKTLDGRMYFRTVPVLVALDADHDGMLTAQELANAPAVLASLDTNHDGKLDAEECGWRPLLVHTTAAQKIVTPPQLATAPRTQGPPHPVRTLPLRFRTARVFMREEPVLAALDANHDGEISSIEIRNATAALKTLDRNHDGRLTLEEVAAGPVEAEVAAIFRLDTGSDGRISRTERQNVFGQHVAMLLDAADRNGKRDGMVTWEELASEIRRRVDRDHDGVVTFEEMTQARKSGALYGPPRETPISRIDGK